MTARKALLQRSAVLIGLATCLAPCPGGWSMAEAQSYPTRQITMIVPFGAGGSSDAIARIVGESMSRTLGKAIVIENDGGAGGTTATHRAAQATPDGYTIVMGNMGTHGSAPSQYPNLRYNPAKDFTPIGLSAGVPLVLITRKDFPAGDLRQFVDYARTNPGKVTEGHAGVGSQTHAMCTMLFAQIDAAPARVAYRSTGAAVNDIIGSQIDFACAALTGVSSQIQAGAVKALAIASPSRAAVIPEVPTTAEAGLPQYQVTAWNALFGPKGLPADVQDALSKALVASGQDPATRKRLLDIGAELPAGDQLSPGYLQSLVERETSRWASVLRAQGGK